MRSLVTLLREVWRHFYEKKEPNEPKKIKNRQETVTVILLREIWRHFYEKFSHSSTRDLETLL